MIKPNGLVKSALVSMEEAGLFSRNATTKTNEFSNLYADMVGKGVKGSGLSTEDFLGDTSIYVQNSTFGGSNDVTNDLSGLSSFRAKVNNCLQRLESKMNSSLSKEDYNSNRYELTNAQKKAFAISVAAFQDPKSLIKVLSESAKQGGAGLSKEDISVQVPDLFKQAMSNESFDGTANLNNVFYSATINVIASRQSDFSEAFYPSIAISPEETGITFSLRVTSFFNEFKRSIDGREPKLNLKPMIKHAFDSDLFAEDRFKIVPKYLKDNEKNASKFVKDLVTDIVLPDGEDGQTAPLVVGQSIDLIGLDMAAGYGLKGEVGNRTDVLYPAIRVKNIYLKVTDDKQKSNILKVNAGCLQNSRALYGNQGHAKDMNINLDGNFRFQIGKALTDAKGNVQVWDDNGQMKTLDGATVVVSFGLNGKVNTELATINVNPTTVTVQKLINAQGGVVEENTLKTFAEKVKIEVIGYDVEAYRVNTNLRVQGQILRNDAFTKVVQVPYVSGFMVQGPIFNYTGDDNDLKSVQAIADSCVLKSDSIAIDRLFEDVEDIKAFAAAPEDYDVDLASGSKYFSSLYLNPYYKKYTLDVRRILNTLNSSAKAADIKASMINYLKQAAIDMYQDSRYLQAHQFSPNANQPAVVLVGTDFVTAQYLLHENEGNIIPLTDKLKLMVVWSPFEKMKGKLFMTFSATDKIGSIDEINILHFGFRAFSPVINLAIQRQNNNTIVDEQFSLPRFLHYAVLPIIVEMDVVGLPDSGMGSAPIKVEQHIALKEEESSRVVL